MGQQIGIKTQQRLALADVFARADQRDEAFALQPDGFQPDVDENFGLSLADNQGVLGRSQIDDFPVQRGKNSVAGRVHGQAVAQHVLAKYGVGHLLQRHGGAGYGGK